MVVAYNELLSNIIIIQNTNEKKGKYLKHEFLRVNTFQENTDKIRS